MVMLASSLGYLIIYYYIVKNLIEKLGHEFVVCLVFTYYA